MKRIILTLIFAAVMCVGAGAQAPRIISMVPAFGECEVDPGLTAIVIKFDQDMSPEYSVPNVSILPQVTGKPVWNDKRTLSIPVKLVPERLYGLQFNSSRYRSFRNLEGVSLNPVDLMFRTKSDSVDTKQAAVAKLNKESYDEFVKFFPKEYSYASLRGADWDALLKEYKSEFLNAKSSIEFGMKLIKMLRVADDAHLWIEMEGQQFQTGKIKLYEDNYNMNHLFSLLKNPKVTGSMESVAGEIDGVGYIAVRGWTSDLSKLTFKNWGDEKSPEYSIEDVVRGFSGYSNLIIDVRENSGGNEAFANDFASYFIKDSVTFEKVVCYDDKSGLVDHVYYKKLYPNNKGLNFSGNIYVLSGPAIMSSNESFILMMKQVPNTKVVGMKTYGSSGNPVPHKLSNGVTVFLPSWQAYSLDGKLIEGSGIVPDIEIVTKRNDFMKEDVLIQKVLDMIKK
jgi:hypothetical protein